MKIFFLSIIATLFFTAANADVIAQSLSKAPVLDISFATQAAVNASEIGTTNLCNIEPLEPVVTISIQ